MFGWLERSSHWLGGHNIGGNGVQDAVHWQCWCAVTVFLTATASNNQHLIQTLWLGSSKKMNGQLNNVAGGARWGTNNLVKEQCGAAVEAPLEKKGKVWETWGQPMSQRWRKLGYSNVIDCINQCYFIDNFRACPFPPSFACLQGRELVFYINSRPCKQFSGDPRWRALHHGSLFACLHACQHFVSIFAIFDFRRNLKWRRGREFGTELRYHLKWAVTLLQKRYFGRKLLGSWWSKMNLSFGGDES